MDIATYAPVKIFMGNSCLQSNAQLFSLGKKALVVTGRRSADACGAMKDVSALLQDLFIPYARFSAITENPLAETCHEGGRFCREEGCDFIIAIGGGSVLDGAKAIAAYAANPEADVLDIYDAQKVSEPGLPLIAIPTTAGTGSEAAPYSVLTLPGGMKKKTFRSPWSWPTYSFVCPKYTYTLSRDYSISTALDALAHAIESYVSPKANRESRKAALYAAREVWDVLFLNKGENDGIPDEGGFTPIQRSRLMYAATSAGLAISITGTGFPHPLGYSLTLAHGIPHGKACAIFEGAFIRYNRLTRDGRCAIDELAVAMDTTVEEMALRIPQMSGVDLTMTKEHAESLIDLIADAGNFANSPYVITRGEMSDIYSRLFIRI